MSFSNEDIRKLEPGKTLWDRGDKNSQPGLHVRAQASGKKSFMLYYRTRSGTQRRPKIGDFPVITVSEARKRAAAINHKVAIGEDPKGEWDETRKEPTVGDIYRMALEKHWSQERYIKSRRKSDVEHLWALYMEKPFNSLRLSEATTVKVRTWHTNLHGTPYAANRAREVLSRIFTFAEEHGHIPVNSNPCTAVPPYPEKSRKRYASPDELKLIIKSLHKYRETHPRGVAYLWMLLLTGSRPIAIERATWNQLQIVEKDGLKYGVLTFFGKTTADTGEDEVVIIPPQAMDIILELPRLADNRIIGCTMPQRLWDKIRTDAKCPDLWARDSRRLFASTGLSSGINLGTIGELLNHQSTQTTKTYAKLMLDARIAAVGSIANQIKSIAEQKEQV